MTRRKSEPREMRLIAEWVGNQFPRDKFILNVRLGQLHPDLHPELLTEEERRLVGVWRRMADAVVIKPDKMLLIEAAIRPQPGDISVLMLYKELLPQTPELSEYSHLPVEMILLAVIEDPVIAKIARQQGIKFMTYRPEWIDEYLNTLYPRQRRASLTVL